MACVNEGLQSFWATVCETVPRCYLTVVCPVCLSVCLSCLSVMLVYCGQTVGWIKIDISSLSYAALVDNECKYCYVILKTVTK